MKDYEILLWLKNIQPESDEQQRLLDALERTYYRVTKEPTVDEELEDFLSAYTRESMIDKPSGELYEEYLDYCTDYDLPEVSHAVLTKAASQVHKLKVRVAWISGKSVRVFKKF